MQFLQSLLNFLHAGERTPQNSQNYIIMPITNCTSFTKPRYIMVKIELSS